jgi:hypothetical protein
MKDLNFYIRLGHDAIPYDDDEWGTGRQINAINLFYTEIEALLPYDKFDDYEIYALKATDAESVAYGLQLIADKLLYNAHYAFLIDTYNTFIKNNKLPLISADDLILYKRLTKPQKKWIKWFLTRWDLFV